MMETMPLPDLPASFSRAATGIRRSSPCAAAAFFVGAAQVITKPGPCALGAGAFLPLQNSYQAGKTHLCFLCDDELFTDALLSCNSAAREQCCKPNNQP